VIVVIGSPVGRLEAGATHAAGTPARIALEVAARDRPVQLVGRVGDDATADAVVLDLARGGVGHVALLRDVAHPTPLEPGDVAPTDVDDAREAPAGGPQDGLALDAADVDLGLRYLTAFEVLVLAGSSSAGLVSVVSDAARWAGAQLVLVLDEGATAPADLPADAVVFEAPGIDPDGAFAALVARFAAALDAGTDPGDAFRASVGAQGWTAAAAD
jgi:sugar/nucleoside kinase (ribokinase family)